MAVGLFIVFYKIFGSGFLVFCRSELCVCVFLSIRTCVISVFRFRESGICVEFF